MLWFFFFRCEAHWRAALSAINHHISSAFMMIGNRRHEEIFKRQQQRRATNITKTLKTLQRWPKCPLWWSETQSGKTLSNPRKKNRRLNSFFGPNATVKKIINLIKYSDDTSHWWKHSLYFPALLIHVPASGPIFVHSPLHHCWHLTPNRLLHPISPPTSLPTSSTQHPQNPPKPPPQPTQQHTHLWMIEMMKWFSHSVLKPPYVKRMWGGVAAVRKRVCLEGGGVDSTYGAERMGRGLPFVRRRASEMDSVRDQ